MYLSAKWSISVVSQLKLQKKKRVRDIIAGVEEGELCVFDVFGVSITGLISN